MNAEEPAAVKKKPGFFARIRSLPGRLSTAGCAAWVLAIFLVVLVAVVWTVFFLDPNHVPWHHSMTWLRIVVIALLVVATPYVFYRALRLWLRGDRSRFPEIDYAWKAGVESLEKNGISLKSTPVFLVLGFPGEQTEKGLMDASGLSFRVRGVPEGPGPLHWYANTEAIYLVCSNASWLSFLNDLVEKQARRALSADLPTEPGGEHEA